MFLFLFQTLLDRQCQCVPWDFVTLEAQNNLSECDVFGRTCFLNVVNNVTHSEVNLCPQCMKSCQYLHFHIVSVKSAPLADDVGMGGMSRYFKYFGDYCYRKDFCIYHLDKNRTFTPLSPAEQMMTKSTKLTDFGSLDRKHKGMIVVNIRFAKPEVDVMTLGSFLSLSN